MKLSTDTATTAPSSTVEGILDAAEAMIRTGGYHAASYRDIAERVKIKSASVHYHFPTKEELGVAVMRRYRNKTMAYLGNASDETQSPAELVRRYIALFRHSLEQDERVCLCGIMVFESGGLPQPVRTAALDMATDHAKWLKEVLLRAGSVDDGAKAEREAWLLVSALQGAMAAAIAARNREVFESVARALEEKVIEHGR